MSEKPMPCDTRIEKFPPLYEVMPCPFCGADREYIVAEEYEHGAGKRWRVFCLSCMATMDKGYCQTQWQALEAWNRRAQPENELITNAQRIRGMSDEELARWLVDATVCERVCHEDEYCHGDECVKRVTDWLQSPAETEGTE